MIIGILLQFTNYNAKKLILTLMNKQGNIVNKLSGRTSQVKEKDEKLINSSFHIFPIHPFLRNTTFLTLHPIYKVILLVKNIRQQCLPYCHHLSLTCVYVCVKIIYNIISSHESPFTSPVFRQAVTKALSFF